MKSVFFFILTQQCPVISSHPEMAHFRREGADYYPGTVKQKKYLAIVFVVEIFLDFSRRSDDLSVDFASSFAGVVARVAVDRRVDLSVQLAHIVGVENVDLVAFFVSAFWEVFVVARLSAVSFKKSIERFLHPSGISGAPFFVRNGLDQSLSEILFSYQFIKDN